MERLTPATCRLISRGSALHHGLPREDACMPGGNGTHSPWPIPMDPYSVPQRHSYGLVELAEAMRGRRILFLGDSVTVQMTGALRCLSASTLPGGIEPVIEEFSGGLSMRERCMKLQALKSRQPGSMCQGGWRRQCSINITELGPERCAHCGRLEENAQQRRAATFAWAHLAWPCKYPSMLEHGMIRLHGFRAPRFNFTWFPALGGKMDRYPTADLRQFGQVEKHSVAWPSRVEFASSRQLVDVLVLNFGLHYHVEGEYVGALRAAFDDLAAFASARRDGRVAVFRETSAQHFAATDGDYDRADASARGFVESSGKSKAKRCSDTDVCVQPCRPLAKNMSAWRNRALHRVASTRSAGGGRGRRWGAIRVQPFESVTRARWDYHVASKTDYNQQRRRWIHDCTHFCYSPSFWQESLHDLRVTIEPGTTRPALKEASRGSRRTSPRRSAAGRTA